MSRSSLTLSSERLRRSTVKLKEDGEEIVLDRLRDILNEVREEIRPSVKEEQVN